LLFIPTVYFLFPETANVPLEDVDYLFDISRKITGGAPERQSQRDERIENEKRAIRRRGSEATVVERKGSIKEVENV
jgi:hypothetical protein